MKRLVSLAAAAVVLLAALSCEGPKRIPRDKMEEIYVDMFLADQRTRSDLDLRNRADTMLVYEAVFEKYGYDTDDFLYSVDYYLQDPERFAKMAQDVVDRLTEGAQQAGAEAIREEWENKLLKMEHVPVDSLLLYLQDSLYGMPGRLDTMIFRTDTLLTESDTLRHE